MRKMQGNIKVFKVIRAWGHNLLKNTIFCCCYVLRFLDFAPYKNSEGVRLRNLGDF